MATGGETSLTERLIRIILTQGWQDMKLLSGVLVAMLMLACIGACQAAVRIANDRGGRIDSYLDSYEELGASGQRVMIDGLCASACTIVLAAIPRASKNRNKN